MWIEHIAEHHLLQEFTCGNKAMDDWLQRRALEWEMLNLSRTYVLTDDGTSVLGYYSLAGIDTEQADLPRALRRGTPQHVAHPGSLLARLAVATRHHGQGLARDLMVDAVRTAADAARQVGGRFIAVDPIDDRARAIYAGWGFLDVPGDANRRMYLGMAQAMAAFADVDDT